MRTVWIGLAGFFGAASRYHFEGWVSNRWPTAFPWGTFAVNVTGCFLLGLIFTLLTERFLPHPDLRRVVVVDPSDRVLLMAVRARDDGRVVWFVPGGGAEPGESAEATARRELAEEIGLTSPVDLQGPIWTRTHTFTWNGSQITQHETFYLCRLSTPMSSDDISPEGPEGDFFVGARWVHPHEIATLEGVVAPRRIAELLVPLLQGNFPDEPIDVGV